MRREVVFALESHRRAMEAAKAGKFKDEIVPIEMPQRKGPPKIAGTDEHPATKSRTVNTYSTRAWSDWPG